MLVLTRRLGESICINDDIRIIIQHIRGNQVRVGIAAPRETVIHREEVYQKILQENKAAVTDRSEFELAKDAFESMKESAKVSTNKVEN